MQQLNVRTTKYIWCFPLGVAHKLRLRDEVGRWYQNVSLCQLHTIENVNAGRQVVKKSQNLVNVVCERPLKKGNDCISSKYSRNATFPSFLEKHLITQQHFEMFHQIVIIQIASHLTIGQNFCKNRLIRGSSIGQAQIMCDANLGTQGILETSQLIIRLSNFMQFNISVLMTPSTIIVNNFDASKLIHCRLKCLGGVIFGCKPS